MAIDDHSFNAGVCVALACVMAQGQDRLWAEIVQAAGEDELLYYAAHVSSDDWRFAGFERFAKAELGKVKPRKRKGAASAAGVST